jgi:hypothetical protein
VQTGSVLETLINKALRMWTEWLAASSQPEIVDTAADFDLLSSAGSGPSSESRRPVSPNAEMLHIWPALDRILRYIIKLRNEEIAPDDLPPDVPVVHSLDGLLPWAGEKIMRRRVPPGYFTNDFPPGVTQVRY